MRPPLKLTRATSSSTEWESTQRSGAEPTRDTPYDFCVVGAGFSGLNAVQAILECKPEASILVIDKHEEVGGCWNDFYGFVKLHQPASVFGVNGQTHLWVQNPDSTLASRHSILDHFQRYYNKLPLNVNFMLKVTMTGWEKDDKGIFQVNTDLPSGAKKTLSANMLIDCRAFNYEVCKLPQRASIALRKPFWPWARGTAPERAITLFPSSGKPSPHVCAGPRQDGVAGPGQQRRDRDGPGRPAERRA